MYSTDGLERVREICRRAVEEEGVAGLALGIAVSGRTVLSEAWGSRNAAGDTALTDTPWLVASITKPVVCAGICLLLERGLLTLDDPVARHLPEFGTGDRAGVTLCLFLSYTSGLHDMLPENEMLRRRHAPLSEFVARICTTPLLFAPGTRVSYQSTGIALLGAVIERITGLTCREFLRHEFFDPLGMRSTCLGWDPALEGHAAECDLSRVVSEPEWNWNSAYWRNLGAPWGGMFSTVPDLLRFLGMTLAHGEYDGKRLLSPATVREMTGNRTADLPHLPEAEWKRSAWGLGWRLAAGRESDYFGDLTSAFAYGHAGSTGCGVWNDPETGISFVFLSNCPGIGRLIGRVAIVVLAASL